MKFLLMLLAATLIPCTTGFTVLRHCGVSCTVPSSRSSSNSRLYEKISRKRREQLGIGDDQDEYDLGQALETNTDPLITKIVAGSFIVVVIALLVVAIVIPATTDYGGACNPLLTGGRC